MHELGVTQEVIDAVLARVNGARVTRIVLEVGRISALLPDAIRFCFDLCAEGTPLEGAALEIVEPPGIARCRVCNGTVQLESIFGYCACGSADLDWLSGKDLKVTRIDVKTDARK
jgi:hydrogenase nickel incorporation protein HypA/HybF